MHISNNIISRVLLIINLRTHNRMEQSGIIIKKSTFICKNESKLEDIYKLGKKKLGSGAFGVVTKCRHRISKQDRACKTIAKKKVKNVAQFHSEINIL